MYTLGVWDGHDSGAALLDDDKIVYAANEERFTKRKLEIRFPSNSIRAALDFAGAKPSDIERVAFTTTELTKTMTRVFPFMKESYYQMRRRKMLKPSFEGLRRRYKYATTAIGILPGAAAVSRAMVARELRRLGFGGFKLDVVEHHTAHAATAAFTSGFKRALVVTLDGVGDGLCGSVSILDNGRLERKQAIGVRDSIGLFYEQATTLLGLRELEDEGKVMAMSCYSYPFPFEENRLKDFFTVIGTTIRAKYGPVSQYGALERICWQMPREQFAYMVQQLLEYTVAKFVSNVIDRYGVHDVVFAGGVFSNVKANMQLRMLDHLKHWYVFPHMGDGGIALGSALYSNYLRNGTTSFGFSSYLGNEYDASYTERALKADKSLKFEPESSADQASHAAELIGANEYIFWFQGRMEYGPRALGGRSILARPDSEAVKDKLNLYVKKREWFQPFCPSMLEDEAGKMLEFDDKGYDKLMTMAYVIKDDMRRFTASVMHTDGSARPQMVGEENPLYMDLIRKAKKHIGHGIVLNTSFNIHGYPIVMTPEDAIACMKATKTKHMFINGLFVTNRAGV